jgi:CubicO group peptidase (beta-lactamase class C family)
VVLNVVSAMVAIVGVLACAACDRSTPTSPDPSNQLTPVLGGVVGSATATRLDVFAQSALFGPLQITGASWVRGLPDGLPHAGGGLNLRPRDMAKLGALVLDDGRWRGQPIVTPAWINVSKTPVTRAVRQWSGHTFDYGYGWWFIDDQGPIVTASGARGQWIFVVPSRRLVVASTGNNDDGRWTAPVDFLYSHVLPAVH